MKRDTKNQNKHALICAVVLNDVEETRNLLSKIEDRSLLNDIGLLSKPFPLHYISICNEVIWHEIEEWRDKVEAMRNRDRSHTMVEFWKKYYGVSDFGKIDYRVYYEDFYCTYPDDTDEDILWAPKSKYVEAGNREIDVDLYCAVCKFDFERTRQLLDLGANPDIDLYETPASGIEERGKGDSWNALDHVGTEEAFLIHETLGLLSEAETDIAKQNSIDYGTIANILGIAAYSDMYRLLDKYIKKQ